MNLIRIHNPRKPFIRLARVGETDSKRTWVFTFVDPIHKLMQSIIVMKELSDAALAVEEAFDKIYSDWSERIKELSWKRGTWN